MLQNAFDRFRRPPQAQEVYEGGGFTDLRPVFEYARIMNYSAPRELSFEVRGLFPNGMGLHILAKVKGLNPKICKAGWRAGGLEGWRGRQPPFPLRSLPPCFTGGTEGGEEGERMGAWTLRCSLC